MQSIYHVDLKNRTTRKTYDDWINYLHTGQETMVYPDRTAKRIRESPYMTQLEGVELFGEIDEREKQRMHREALERAMTSVIQGSGLNVAATRALIHSPSTPIAPLSSPLGFMTPDAADALDEHEAAEARRRESNIAMVRESLGGVVRGTQHVLTSAAVAAGSGAAAAGAGAVDLASAAGRNFMENVRATPGAIAAGVEGLASLGQATGMVLDEAARLRRQSAPATPSGLYSYHDPVPAKAPFTTGSYGLIHHPPPLPMPPTSPLLLPPQGVQSSSSDAAAAAALFDNVQDAIGAAMSADPTFGSSQWKIPAGSKQDFSEEFDDYYEHYIKFKKKNQITFDPLAIFERESKLRGFEPTQVGGSLSRYVVDLINFDRRAKGLEGKAVSSGDGTQGNPHVIKIEYDDQPGESLSALERHELSRETWEAKSDDELREVFKTLKIPLPRARSEKGDKFVKAPKKQLIDHLMYYLQHEATPEDIGKVSGSKRGKRT